MRDNDITIDVPNIVDSSNPGGDLEGVHLVSGRPEQPRRIANILDFSQFSADLVNDTVADYVWISTLRFARSSGHAYNHYSISSAIERSWKLDCLANTWDRKDVRPMTDLVGPLRFWKSELQLGFVAV
jgi:hypothetical protein